MGATYRNGSFGYPYYGTIDSVRVYDTALAQDVLEAETYIEKDSGIIRQENVFSFEDWNTEGIRIPSIRGPTRGRSLPRAISGSATPPERATILPTTATSASGSVAMTAQPGANPKCCSIFLTTPTNPRSP